MKPSSAVLNAQALKSRKPLKQEGLPDGDPLCSSTANADSLSRAKRTSAKKQKTTQASLVVFILFSAARLRLIVEPQGFEPWSR